MKAAVLHSGRGDLAIEDVPPPAIGPGLVRIGIKCCGICGSDLHITVDKKIKLKSYPRIPGHESSGVVLEIGEGVTRYKKSDRVIIAAGTSCGQCDKCRAGMENACEKVGVLGFDADGAFAQEIVVPERSLTILPDAIPFDQGAILADAVSTPYHAVKYAGRMKPGESVAVFGCGGLGIHGVMLAKALGASKIYALDVDPGALSNASRYANETLDLKTIKNSGKTLKQLSGGIDLVLDFSGRYDNIENSVRAMNTLGRLVMVGIGHGHLTLALPPIMTYRQLSIIGSYGSDRRAIPELLDLYLAGKLPLADSITSHHPLEDINECLHNLHQRRGNPIRFIIEP